MQEFSTSYMRLITLVRSARTLGRDEQSVGVNDTRRLIRGCITDMVNDRKIATEEVKGFQTSEGCKCGRANASVGGVGGWEIAVLTSSDSVPR